MFDYFSGVIQQKKPTEVVLDVQGVGYLLRISLSTYRQLPDKGSKVTLKSYLHVREDAMQLFGFSDTTERDVFLGLLSISGIGPKLAQTILSGLTPAELVQAIRLKDEKKLNAISGVGKKTAQRLVVELSDKFATIESTQEEFKAVSAPVLNAVEQEALMALLTLGYNRGQAERAIGKAQKSESVTVVEDLLKKALQVI